MRVGWVERVVLGIFADQISTNGLTLGYVKAVVVDGRYFVHWIHLEEFGLHLFTGHKIQHLEISVDTGEVGRHHHSTTRWTQRNVIQINRHFYCYRT